MRAHLAVDVVENGVALSQRPQAIAKNVEPPHVAKPFLYFPGLRSWLAAPWRSRARDGPNSLPAFRDACVQCASVCKTSPRVRFRARPNAPSPNPFVLCDRAPDTAILVRR